MAIVVRGICWELTLAAVVWLLAPAPSRLSELARNPQRYVDVHGADDAAVLVAATLLCGICVLVAVAVALAAAGELGRVRVAVLRVVIPNSWVRRLAVVLLGLAVLPAAACGPQDPSPNETGVSDVQKAAPTVIDQFDWPAAGQSQAPPATQLPAPSSYAVAPQGAGHTVVAGDCLWSIAATHLGPGASLSEIAGAVDEIWQLNLAEIGADPDQLLPGQVLQLPLTIQPA